MSALPDGTRLGQYRITRLIGEGGMGAVYEARHESLDRRVAVKTLHPSVASQQSIVTRFFNEARVLSKLEHPSIVQISDFGTSLDGTTYLVMEYLRGESLGKRLSNLAQRGECLQLAPALQICWQVADVLAMAHALGIVHRDIKPDNLMLVADPIAPGGERVKVLDFGIAKLSGNDVIGGSKTATNTLMGTPMYMSPEQCAGAGRVDDKTDVYALGCVLYQALAGRPPFEAEGTGELIGMHLYHSPPPLAVLAPKLPGSIVQFVHRMLSKNKSDRPDMSSIADRIGHLLKQYASGPTPVRSRVSEHGDGSISTQAPPLLATRISQTAGEPSRVIIQQVRLGLVLVSALGLAVAALWFAVKPGARPPPTLAASIPPPEPMVNHSIAPLMSAGAIMDLSLMVDLTSTLPDLSPEGRTPPLIVHWHIDSEPRGAQVLDASGQVHGITPLSVELPSSPGLTRFSIRLDGYVDSSVSLDGSRDDSPKVFLRRKTTVLKTPTSILPNLIKSKQELGYED